jgi:hypothetical protein
VNYLEWSRRAVRVAAETAAKVLGRTYRWLRKLESEMTDRKPLTTRSTPGS